MKIVQKLKTSFKKHLKWINAFKKKLWGFLWSDIFLFFLRARTVCVLPYVSDKNLPSSAISGNLKDFPLSLVLRKETSTSSSLQSVTTCPMKCFTDRSPKNLMVIKSLTLTDNGFSISTCLTLSDVSSSKSVFSSSSSVMLELVESCRSSHLHHCLLQCFVVSILFLCLMKAQEWDETSSHVDQQRFQIALLELEVFFVKPW